MAMSLIQLKLILLHWPLIYDVMIGIRGLDRTQIMVLITLLFLPPANEVCEGYVFIGDWSPTGGGGGRSAPLHAGIHIPLGRHPLGRHPLSGQTPPWADTPRTCAVYAGIQSTSGWYASHWNAFLFVL